MADASELGWRVVNEYYGVPKRSKSTEVVDHSVYAYFDIHVHV